MIKFSQWIEQQQLQLPPIPSGSIRLTHFTSPKVAKNLLNGQDFSYKTQGLLSSTTDSFSNNNSIINLIQTGKIDTWDRNSFGIVVVLMDMPNNEYRIHNNISISNGTVANDRIVGIVDRNTMQFTPNAHYNPTPQPLIIQQKEKPTTNPNTNLPQIPIPQPTSKDHNLTIF
jgi:hypothetical protein